MGSSFTAFGAFGFWTRDPCLEPWAGLLATMVASDPSSPDWLQAAAKDWDLMASGQFMGMVSLALDDAVAGDPQRIGTLVTLGEKARDRLLEQIRTVGAAQTAAFYDMNRIESLLEVADAFRDLLLGRITWTSATSPMVGTAHLRQAEER